MLRNESGASEGHFFFLPPFLMPQGQTLLAGTPLPFNSVEGSNMQTHKGDLLHSYSCSQPLTNCPTPFATSPSNGEKPAGR